MNILKRAKKIDKLLNKRYKDYPKRLEPNWSILMEEIGLFAKDVFAKSEIKKPPLEIRKIVDDFIDKPVFIVGYYKSGTSLLRGLFDSHPEVAVLATESSHFSIFVKKYKEFSRAKKTEQISRRWLKKLITPSGKPPFWVLGKPWNGRFDNYLRFVAYLRWFSKKYKNNNLLCCVAVSYWAVMQKKKQNKNIAVKYWMEKTPTNEFYVRNIIDKYPRAKFIHVLRDPRAIIASILKIRKERDIGSKIRFVKKLKDLFYFFYHLIKIGQSYNMGKKSLKKLGKKNYLFLKYEDLVEFPEKELKRTCKFLGIKYSKVLLKPTTAGRDMISNSAWKDGRVKGKIDKKSKDRWKTDLGFLQIFCTKLITMKKVNFNQFLYFPVYILKRSRGLSALSCRLSKWTGKSKYPIHPKHLIRKKDDWYLKDIKKNDVVLDLGCGNGQHTLKTAKKCKKIIGFDYDEGQLKIGRKSAEEKRLKNVRFKKRDLEKKLPFKNNKFDKILALDILEHLYKRNQFLKEIWRILKPGALVYLAVPNKNTSWKKMQRRVGLNSVTDPDHKIEYSLKEIKMLVGSLDYKIVRLEPIVFDTPWAGFIDFMGGFSLKLYERLLAWKKNKAENNLKESIGFKIILKKN